MTTDRWGPDDKPGHFHAAVCGLTLAFLVTVGVLAFLAWFYGK